MNKKFTLVTGATGGLGSKFCIKMAKLNKNLFITSRSQEKLNILTEKLYEISPNIVIFSKACDFTDTESRNDLFKFIIDNNLSFEMLINVAGVDIQKPFVNYTEEKIVLQSRSIFEGTISITNFILKQNLDDLKILTISSICGTLPMPYFAIYSSLKHALIDFFDALRVELKSNKNVVITTILPGSIPTRPDIVEDIKKQGLTGKLSKKSPEYVVEKSLKALKNRKKNYIPGFYNKVVNFFQKITPKSIKMKIIASKFSKKEKDAF